jgi:hypothetical protein
VGQLKKEFHFKSGLMLSVRGAADLPRILIKIKNAAVERFENWQEGRRDHGPGTDRFGKNPAHLHAIIFVELRLRVNVRPGRIVLRDVRILFQNDLDLILPLRLPAEHYWAIASEWSEIPRFDERVNPNDAPKPDFELPVGNRLLIELQRDTNGLAWDVLCTRIDAFYFSSVCWHKPGTEISVDRWDLTMAGTFLETIDGTHWLHLPIRPGNKDYDTVLLRAV